MGTFSNLRRHIMLTCQDVNAFIIDYLEDTLEPDLRERFETHLKRCSICNTYFEQYRKTIALAKETGDTSPKPPAEIANATLDFLRQHLNPGASSANDA